MPETNQDALIRVEYPGMKENPLTKKAESHIQALRAAGVLNDEHELIAALVVRLATIAGNTFKGYAAAQIFRELREAIDALPKIEEEDDISSLAEYLESLGHGEAAS